MKTPVTVVLKLCLFQALLHNEPNWFQTTFGSMMLTLTSMARLQTLKWLSRNRQTLTLLLLWGLSFGFTGNLLRDFIISSKVDPVTAVKMDQLMAQLPKAQLLLAEWELLGGFIVSNVASVQQALDLMDYARQQELPVSMPMLDMVSHLRSTARAAPPPSCHGTLKDHGQPARLWVFSFVSYLQACNESKPVPFVTSYLQDDALAWWQSLLWHAKTFGCRHSGPVPANFPGKVC